MKLVLAGLAVILVAGCSQQQNTNSNAALEAKVAALKEEANEIEPGLGDIMGVIEQHHTKLYYAGTKKNWPLAAYELDEIRESLEEAMELYPHKFKNVSVPPPQIIPAMTKSTIAGVQQAIRQKNEKAFVQAYQALSNSCSSCHAAENHPFIKIQTPAPGMFSDQNFAP
jgi:hypothetical protein